VFTRTPIKFTTTVQTRPRNWAKGLLLVLLAPAFYGCLFYTGTRAPSLLITFLLSINDRNKTNKEKYKRINKAFIIIIIF